MRRRRHRAAVPRRPVDGWQTGTRAQKGAWINRIASKCGTHGCRGCGQFKSRPSTQCQHCGLIPLPNGMDPYMFDREWGFDG